MNNENKKGIRWKLFNLFGPPELQNLVNYIDDLTDQHTDIVIYPMGQFPFEVKTSNQKNQEPLMFDTAQERTAFLRGLDYGVNIMGGSTATLSKDEFDELDLMDNLSTHSDKKNHMN